MTMVLRYVLILLLFFSCTQDKAPKAQNSADKADIVASVNGSHIYKSDFQDALQMSGILGKASKEQKDQVLDELVKMELLIQDAKSKGIYESENIAFKVRKFERNLLVNSYVKKYVQDKVVLKNEEVSKYYEENTDKMYDREKVHAAHILVGTQEQALEVIEKLQHGSEFEALAASLSKDKGSKDNGGDLGFFPKGAMVAEFEEAAFSLAPGEVSRPVKTKFGYHVIKVYEKKPPEKLPLDRVENIIRGQLLKNKQKQLIQEITDKLKQRANITISKNEH